jgi:hypothetical protein
MAEEEPSLDVQVDRTRLYEGESVLYQVLLNNVENPVPPRLEGFSDFEIVPAGERSLNSSQTFILNGRVTRIEKRGREYRYRLTPRSTGTVRIPAPSAEVEGRVLRGKSITLQVIAAQEQDTAMLEIEVEPAAVYPLQSFTVTLKILIRALPDVRPYAGRSPLSVQKQAPALTIPWATSPPEGLVPTTDLNRWLSPYTSRGSFFDRDLPAGFTINDISSSFSFFSNNAMVFQLESARVKRKDSQGEEQPYWEYTLRRTFTPERTGDFLFGPVTLKGVFATGKDERGGLEGENIYAIGKAAPLVVKEVPEEGKPETFTGAVGLFELKGSLTPDRARVGDPMTLTLTLTGRGTLDTARAPDLTRLPEVAERFKLYEATEETQGVMRTFTYSLRPMKADITEFPPVELSYFDVERERYVPLRTEPIPLTIEEAAFLEEGDIVTQSQKPGKSARIEAQKEGIFANVTDLSALRNEAVRPRLYVAIMGGMAAFYGLALLLTRRIRRITNDPALQRRRGASARAKTRLRGGISAIQSGDVRGGMETCRTALVGLVADAADLPEAGLAARDVVERLEALGVDRECTSEVADLLEVCDAARFGALSLSETELASRWQRVLDGLIAALRKAGRLR